MLINLHPETNIAPATGKVLISEPFLGDPYFKRTIVLLCEYSKEGAFGFVLNKYVNLDITELLEGFPGIKSRIGIGGPVQNTNLYYLHTRGDIIPNAIPVSEYLFMGGDFERMQELVREKTILPSEIRFFIGYAGWDAGQLDEELEQKSWFVGDISSQQIMNTSQNDLWEKVLKDMGGDYELLTQFPEDPSLN